MPANTPASRVVVRLKPMIVCKGTDDRCMTKLQRQFGMRITLKHSATGWSNGMITMDYINEVIAKETNNEQSVLILDRFSGHETDDVKAAAAVHNVHLIVVPARATPTCQPLDTVTFGALKTQEGSISTHHKRNSSRSSVTFMVSFRNKSV